MRRHTLTRDGCDRLDAKELPGRARCRERRRATRAIRSLSAPRRPWTRAGGGGYVPPMIDETLVARARGAAEAVAPLAARIEAERRLPAEAVAALTRAGVWKLLVPRAYGGTECGPATALAAIEQIAIADGSAGWCAMIGATSGLMSVYLDDDVARAVYGADDAVTCGVFAPVGRAATADGGWRVTGRWPFASACEIAQFRMGGVLVDGEPPIPRCALFRADETRVIDTWDTSGLRGTGSHDIEATDVLVPRERTFSLVADRPRRAGYAYPFFGVLAAGVAVVGLGIARAALDGFVALARSKTPAGARRTLAHRELVQTDVARAEGRLSAARGSLFDAIAAATTGVEPSLGARARLRIAACHAADEAEAVTATVYRAAGGSAVYARSPLQRHFRDAHVVTHHVMVGATAATLAGRVLLGVESETSTL
jgi:alkylation response protein AidB-like acyl-CoA dehydrogenase